MATTGADLYKIFENKIDKAYSSFINPTRANRLFKESLFTAIENKKKNLDSQKEYDELKLNITTNKVYVPNRNRLYTADLSVTGVTFSGFIVTVTTALHHNVLVGDSITLTGVLGITNVNGVGIVSAVISTTQFSFIAAGIPVGTYTANTGTLTSDKIISDYMHLMAVKSKYTKQYFDLTVKDATNTSPIILTLSDLTNLRSYEQVTISGVLGNTAANGTLYIKKISSKKISLYSDKDLQIAVPGNGAYFSGGIISRINYEYCTYYYSDRKIGAYSSPTIEFPKVELSKNLLKFYPLDEICQEITIDYLSTATVLPVVTDTVIDLETYYPYKFLTYVCDVAASLFAQQVRDGELTQTTQLDLKQND